MTNGIFIRLLTGGDLIVEGLPAVNRRGRNARILLSLLAMHPGEPLARDHLAGLVWPESDQASARRNLRMALLGLRRSLVPLAPELLSASTDMLSLEVPAEEIDLHLFRRLAAGRDPASLQAALELYRGDLLAGLPLPDEATELGELFRAERERLRATAIETGLSLAAQREETGDLDDALGALRFALAVDPADEQAHRAAIRIKLRRGDRAGAFRHFETCRDALWDLYGVDPSPQTLALRDEIVGRMSAEESRQPSGEPVPHGLGVLLQHSTIQIPPLDGTPRQKPATALMAAVVLTGAFSWIAWQSLAPAPGSRDPVRFVIGSIQDPIPGCARADLGRDMTDLVQRTVLSLPDAVVVLPGSGGELRPSLGDYAITSSVQCSGNSYVFRSVLNHSTVPIKSGSAGTTEFLGIWARSAENLGRTLLPCEDLWLKISALELPDPWNLSSKLTICAIMENL